MQIEQTELTLTELIEACSTILPDNLSPWRRVVNLHPLLFAKMLSVYHPFIADSSSWIKWAGDLSDPSNLLLVHPNGWIFIDRISYNHSAYIHGARWSSERRGKIQSDIKTLLSSIFTEFDLDRLYALIPDHAKESMKLLLNLDFSVHTTFPKDQSFNGTKVDMFLLSLPRNPA